MQEKGTISVHTENIFPVIKKFLYSDHEVFLRELVSNAVDAVQKLEKLSSLGEYKEEPGRLFVKVSVNDKNKTITVSDNGIGMTAEEIKKYINRIAFSGAVEFLENYKDSGDEKQMIGHFGLGFYSAFMVADKVEIITKSYAEGAEAAKWTCDGTTEFEITKTVKKERGTDIVLHINKDSEEFLDKNRIAGILEKYCKFLPVEVEFDGKVINGTQPLWVRPPAELKDEDYLAFYRDLYPFTEDPLFWIHLNVDYPFRLTGILYFPKLKKEVELQRNKIKLYSKQVFITDEVKDIVPEFLMLLHGVIDSPDIPLNVSRSYLQSDSEVKKISGYITRKVADKLSELFKSDRPAFEQKWNDIGLFVKYGMLSDEKFYERAKDFCLLKSVDERFYTLEEYKALTEPLQKDKAGRLTILYCSDRDKQGTYIQAAKKRNYDVVLFDSPIDVHFIGLLESKLENTAFKRVDAEAADKLIDKGEAVESVLNEEETKRLKEIFEKAAGEGSRVTVESLSVGDMPVTVTVPEFIRRMEDMAYLSGGNPFGAVGNHFQVAVNANHALMQNILKTADEEKAVALARHCYDLALIAQGQLKGEELGCFLERSLEFLN